MQKIDRNLLIAWDKHIKKSKILIIGDIMLDVYIQGQVHRISPEAPVPIVNITDTKTCLGGAANVAFNIQAMGATPILCGIIGNDIKGREFIQTIEAHNMPTQGIATIDNRQTTTKTRVIGNKVQLLRIDEETDQILSLEDSEKLYEHIKNLLLKEEINAIIFEDYDKGVITPLLIDRITQLAIEKSIPITVDPKKRNFLNYKNVTIFKPNLSELKNGLDIDKNDVDIESLNNKIKQFKKENQIDIVMTTMSDKGIMIAYNKKSEHTYDWIPAHFRSIADVSGAGDTVISIATLALIYGFSPTLIAELSNIAGGLVCESIGVVPIDKSRFFEECLSILG
ncbi:MAG TPA: bifunctional ADP-heptose synthase [Bacteroidales bacterium]|nr:bifunctional ADP-heptose synthase [Bacteroidales bacterium]HOR81592.1 bifunctional ADP-heptose synthase [Bacteroidales bacterium]HPJ90332.1 bifunctional ADP-heptose synthase [Bacteroidales bacterium]HQB19358.1 bifunctional ADP-heptose synthase [Bacteroidales bacterium]